jgi:large subunit ribosomal protein L15
MVFKTKKRKKSKGQRGNNSYGRGSRKQGRGKGDSGGKGMAGTGKRADQKKSLIIKLYGNSYFGKRGITSKGTKKDKSDVINLGNIEKNYKEGNLDLSSYKILGDGKITKKFTIKARSASKSAIKKIESVGGKIILKTKEVNFS